MDNRNVYLNGDYLPLKDAKVSVLDRGFLFGDGVYEVIPCYQGHFFEFEAHIIRLKQSLAETRIASPYTQEQWREILLPLIDSTLNQYIYLHLTRGVAPKRDHAFPESIRPTVFAMCSNIVPVAGVENGIKTIILDDSRWNLCHVKATTLLANVLLRQEAIDNDSTEAILIKDGYVTEGAASNLFALIDGVLTTPPLSKEILSGITREVILKIAKANNIAVAEAQISVEALKSAQEIWLTSSTREIVPVIELDNVNVADGKVGALWHTVTQLFQAYKQSAR
ncbi:MAG: D-amino acid aminotransferase [Methylococcaceae bacterium]|nr:D-amino acid aminotransferase [Methylococcaceae bacterium]